VAQAPCRRVFPLPFSNRLQAIQAAAARRLARRGLSLFAGRRCLAHRGLSLLARWRRLARRRLSLLMYRREILRTGGLDGLGLRVLFRRLRPGRRGPGFCRGATEWVRT
jgi:hypothetical protein